MTKFALVERKNGYGYIHFSGTLEGCMKKQAEIKLDRPTYVVWRG
jgi:hypothetical protein